MSAVQVIEWDTGEVVHTVDTTGKSERMVEKVMLGMLTNMDRDRFGVREVGDDEDAPASDTEPTLRGEDCESSYR